MACQPVTCCWLVVSGFFEFILHNSAHLVFHFKDFFLLEQQINGHKVSDAQDHATHIDTNGSAWFSSDQSRKVHKYAKTQQTGEVDMHISNMPTQENGTIEVRCKPIDRYNSRTCCHIMKSTKGASMSNKAPWWAHPLLATFRCIFPVSSCASWWSCISLAA